MVFIKRINNELKKFPEIMHECNINIKCCELNVIETCALVSRRFGVFQNKNMIVQLDIPSDYPFKPPIIYVINNNNNNLMERYDRWSSKILNSRKCKETDYFLAWAFTIINNPKLSVGWNFIPTNDCKKCLCCESVTCENNWFACCCISNILIEYIGRRYFVNNCSKLRQRLIKPIFENDRWTIPDDIILYIVQIIIDGY